jgi:adenosylcobinamide-GDP ribazoletransferase
VLVLGLKFTALASIADRQAAIGVMRTFIAGHVVARWSSVPLMMKYSYARPAATNTRPSAGGPFASRLAWPRAAASTLIAGGIAVVALDLRAALIVAAVAVIVTMLAGAWFQRRIGGITGDTLGAANQIVELSVYLTLLGRV